MVAIHTYVSILLLFYVDYLSLLHACVLTFYEKSRRGGMERLNNFVREAVSVVGVWCGRHRILTITIGGIAFLLFWSWLVGGWWLLTEGPRQALTAYNNIPDKEKVEAFGKLATALGLLVAAPFALLGVGLAFWRTWNQHRDSELAARKLETESELAARKLDAEAFAKAVEQLGHAEIAIRMGAVLALQNLAEASPRRLLGQTLEILCAYVREKRPRTKEKDEQDAVPLETDIKLILEVIKRLNRRNDYEKIPIDLSKTDLRGADLSKAYLVNSNFSYSNMSKINLSGANMEQSRLNYANLQHAELSNSNIQYATIFRSDLRDCSFVIANLSGVSLWEVNLQDANLGSANLSRATLEEVNLQGAYLKKANLEGARLSKVNLEGAKLTGTILEKKDEAGG
jgi:uncharacterized protein YjbI with pentapeptide repeats